MKTLSLAEAKTSFSSVIKEMVSGTEIAVSYGKRKETVAVIVPYERKDGRNRGKDSLAHWKGRWLQNSRTTSK
ncbi:hypothetical protein FACS1894204_02510 [Synergistales bacterium]|nr:hypothetical protein AGMMS49957_11550 [Synergistales bacterium]GHS89052.1 hypothetical protein AGMMS49957_11610 [Synergistales bacterium]GHV44793.1 hypothetical protein FACS1894204_02510 [Synergistales bacterium]